MATAQAQRRWRARNRSVKSQLNIMATRLVHNDLAALARDYDLRGKAEAVAFASFVARGLQQYAERDPAARELFSIFHASYVRDRDLYT